MLCYKMAIVLAYCSKLNVGDKCIFILKLPHVLSKNTEQMFGHRLAIIFSNLFLSSHYFTPQGIT